MKFRSIAYSRVKLQFVKAKESDVSGRLALANLVTY